MDRVLFRELCKGFITHVPVLRDVSPRLGAGGGTRSASYCYGVWLKHMTFLLSHSNASLPEHVAELGPGDSLGVGYAMLLGGAKRYSAFDVVEHASDVSTALSVFDRLQEMIAEKVPRPLKGWPDFDEFLDDNLFPSGLLHDTHLVKALAAERVNSLRKSISGDKSSEHAEAIRYVAPWSDVNTLQENVMDLVFSHSVLEYMDDLDACYQRQWQWLRPGGYISHQIDLTGHSLSANWDGFRGYGEKTWSLVRGKRPFGLNRQPCSAHIDAIKRAGFDIVLDFRRYAEPETVPATRWSELSTEDLSTSGLFVQARKPMQAAQKPET